MTSSPSSGDDHRASDEIGPTCPWCRGYFYLWTNEPPVVLGSTSTGEISVLRCERCGTLWQESVWTTPHPITADKASEYLIGQ